MGEDFPLPRSELPRIEVTPAEHAATKSMMDRMLMHTVREFEAFAYTLNGQVNPDKWKPFAKRDHLHVYKERQVGEMSASLAFAFEGASGVLPMGSTVAGLTPASMLLTGMLPGRVENAMYAVVTKSQQELAMVVTYLHEDVADCAILKTMEGPTPDNPYNFLGYKYFVKRSPGLPQLIKHRDSLYLESCGVTTTSKGEQLGFHLMHSVDLPSFPDLTARNSVRALQSVRYLYRQKTDNIVEIFMLGNLDISGMIIQPIANTFVAETLFGITKLVDCAETKQLTQMIMRRRQRFELERPKTRKDDECSICRHKKKHFAASLLLTRCDICSKFVCSRCRTQKKVYIPNSDRILGKFDKVHCCKTCSLVASAGRALPKKLVNTPQQMTSPAEKTIFADDNDNKTPTSDRVTVDAAIVFHSDTEMRVGNVNKKKQAHPLNPNQQYYKDDRGHKEIHHGAAKRSPVPTTTGKSLRPKSSSANDGALVCHTSYDIVVPPTRPRVPSTHPLHYNAGCYQTPPVNNSFTSTESSNSVTGSTPSSYSSPRNDLMQAMIHLNVVAESAAMTTQQNAAYLAQVQRNKSRRYRDA